MAAFVETDVRAEEVAVKPTADPIKTERRDNFIMLLLGCDVEQPPVVAHFNQHVKGAHLRYRVYLDY